HISSITLYSLSSTPHTPPHIYTPSLHDALPISRLPHLYALSQRRHVLRAPGQRAGDQRSRGTFGDRDRGALARCKSPPVAIAERDRKSTRLNSSHLGISYAVFCLKKKKKRTTEE